MTEAELHPKPEPTAFEKRAMVSQSLQSIIYSRYAETVPQNGNMPPFMLESLAVICHHLAKIASNNPNDITAWDTISTYANEVRDLLSARQ